MSTLKKKKKRKKNQQPIARTFFPSTFYRSRKHACPSVSVSHDTPHASEHERIPRTHFLLSAPSSIPLAVTEIPLRRSPKGETEDFPRSHYHARIRASPDQHVTDNVTEHSAIVIRFRVRHRNRAYDPIIQILLPFKFHSSRLCPRLRPPLSREQLLYNA